MVVGDGRPSRIEGREFVAPRVDELGEFVDLLAQCGRPSRTLVISDDDLVKGISRLQTLFA